jgi:diguanylate cyclase (GGDEF)-like protein
LPRVTLAGRVLAVYGTLAVTLPFVGDERVVVAAAIVAPAGALLACIAAVRSLSPAAGGPWVLLALASMAALVAEGLHPLFEGGAVPFPGRAAALALFAVGLAWTIHQRDRGRQTEIALDVVLIVGAASVALMRWAPGVYAVMEDPAAYDFVATIDTIITPVAAVCGIAFATVLVSSLRNSRAGDSAAAIAGAAILLGVSAVPPAMGGLAGTPGTPFVLAQLCGWGLLAFAGLRVHGGGTELFLPADTDPGGAQLRQGVAPVVALVVAVLVVDAGTRDPLGEPTAVAVGLLCVGLALRVSRLLEATRDRHAEQLKLAQSRALVEVSHALAGATNLDDALQRVANWTVRLLGAQSAAIEMLTDDSTVLEVRAAVGFPDEILRMRFPVDQSFTGWVVRHGITRTTIDASTEAEFHPDSRRYLGRMPVAAAPLRYHDRMLGVLACVASQPFDRAGLEMLGALADQAAIAIENARLFEQVNVLSRTDPLTGLANRRQLESDLEREFSAAVRGRALVAVMFDLNDFKVYNDHFGHLAGDEALRTFGQVLRTETRVMNFAARYGGDEFVVLLADTPEDGARIFALRVRRQFARHAMRAGRPLTASAGFGSYDRSMKRPEDLLAAADAALYRAKAKRTRAAG